MLVSISIFLNNRSTHRDTLKHASTLAHTPKIKLFRSIAQVMARSFTSWQTNNRIDRQLLSKLSSNFVLNFVLILLLLLLPQDPFVLNNNKCISRINSVQALPIGLQFIDDWIVNKLNLSRIKQLNKSKSNNDVTNVIQTYLLENNNSDNSINYISSSSSSSSSFSNENFDNHHHHILTNDSTSSVILSQPIVIDDDQHLHDHHKVNQSSKFSFAIEIVLRILLFIYCCLVIGYLCDEYFVPSLSSIGQTLNLREDLIGAILIPFGTSGPEIFSSAVGVFFTENDIGTGAIIGSGVFNILAIPAACGLAAAYFLGKSIHLQKNAILRDLTFYFISIIVLILAIKDNKVDFIDSLLFTILFVVYIGVMFYNGPHEHVQKTNVDKSNQISSESNQTISFPRQDISSSPRQNNPHRLPINHSDQNDLKLKENSNKFNEAQHQAHKSEFNREHGSMLEVFFEDFIQQQQQLRLTIVKSEYEILNNDDDDDDGDDNGVGFIDHFVLRILLMPFIIIYSLTMPSRYPVITFLFSIIWLSLLSYVTVWSISGLSDMIGIPSTISGMTILAAGSAVPDLVTSIIVIKKTGQASMGICAAIASNIFAILLGLGLPWAIQFTMNWIRTGNYQLSSIALQSSALPFTSILLLAIVASLYATFRHCNWEVSKKFSLICSILHILFIIISLSLELSLS